jgi:hypothetical protein
MKKLFCFTILSVAFSVIGSQRGTPIQEYFGPARSEQSKGQSTGPQPIRHSFGHPGEEDDPWYGYFGPARYQDTSPKKSGEQGKSQVVQPQSNSDQVNKK